jgi:hypothetical protein
VGRALVVLAVGAAAVHLFTPTALLALALLLALPAAVILAPEPTKGR